MGIFAQLLNKPVAVEGELGYFGLGRWWFSAFSKVEREHIEEVFQPEGAPAGSRPLTKDHGYLSASSAASLLSGLAASLGRQITQIIRCNTLWILNDAGIYLLTVPVVFTLQLGPASKHHGGPS